MSNTLGNSFLNSCKFTAVAGGLTDWEFGSAVQGYVGPDVAAVNGATYHVRAESADLSQWEIARGTWNAATQKFARTTVVLSSSGTSKVNFSAPPTVGVTFVAADLDSPASSLAAVRASKTSGAQSIGASSYTKVTFNVEDFDEGSFFASSTWTPPAGKVQITANVLFQGLTAGTGSIEVDVFKNGASIAADVRSAFASTAGVSVTLMDTCNGTDTYEVYAWQNSNNTTANIYGGAGKLSNFNAQVLAGSMVGPAGADGVSGPTNLPKVDVSGDKTFALTDAGKFNRHTSGSAHAWTIPPNSSVAFAIGDTITCVVPQGQGAITITRGSGVALYLAGASNTDANRTLSAVGVATLLKIDTDTWVINGAGVS